MSVGTTITTTTTIEWNRWRPRFDLVFEGDRHFSIVVRLDDEVRDSIVPGLRFGVGRCSGVQRRPARADQRHSRRLAARNTHPQRGMLTRRTRTLLPLVSARLQFAQKLALPQYGANPEGRPRRTAATHSQLPLQIVRDRIVEQHLNAFALRIAAARRPRSSGGHERRGPTRRLDDLVSREGPFKTTGRVSIQVLAPLDRDAGRIAARSHRGRPHRVCPTGKRPDPCIESRGRFTHPQRRDRFASLRSG